MSRGHGSDLNPVYVPAVPVRDDRIVSDAPQPVVIADARSGEWAERFRRMRDSLAVLLPEAFIEHIGSTAVPGLPAKDVVDVLIGVAPEALDRTVELLRREGFDIEGHRTAHAWASLPDRSARRFVIHVVEHGGARWADRIRFRDALLVDAELRDEYLALKRRAAAAAEGWGDYTARKADFVRGVLERGAEPPA